MNFGASKLAETRERATSRPAHRLPPRYPVELIDVLTMKNGQRVTIRPILAQDRAVAKIFFDGLSMRSRHNRFLRAIKDLPNDLLTQLISVDHRVHLALIAEIFSGGREIAIGEARYGLSADEKTAEFAISIADEWQGQGLGTLLLRRLIEAATKAGVQTITGEALASNTAMLRLAQNAGFSYALDTGIAGVVHLNLNLAG